MKTLLKKSERVVKTSRLKAGSWGKKSEFYSASGVIDLGAGRKPTGPNPHRITALLRKLTQSVDNFRMLKSLALPKR
jgi:hypothetical protein